MTLRTEYDAEYRASRQDAATEVIIPAATVQLVSQSDLRTASYAIYLAAESERDGEKRAALKRVEDALWQITNFGGADAIGSYEVLKACGRLEKPDAT